MAFWIACSMSCDIIHPSYPPIPVEYRSELRQQLGNQISVHVGQPEVAALEPVGEPGVVEAQQVQDRGLQVVDVDRVFDDVEAQVVGLADASGPA